MHRVQDAQLHLKTSHRNSLIKRITLGMTGADKNSSAKSRPASVQITSNFILFHVYRSEQLSQKRCDVTQRLRERERIDRGKRPSAFPFVESIRQCARNNATLTRLHFLTVCWITCSLAKDAVVSVVKTETHNASDNLSHAPGDASESVFTTRGRV